MSRKPNGDRPPEVNIRRIPKDTKLSAKHWVVDYFDDDVDHEHPYGHRHQIQCKSEGEAKKLGARVITELSRGIHTSSASSMTIADAAMSYLEACRLGSFNQDGTPCRNSTLAVYRNAIEIHITGWLPDTLWGGVKIGGRGRSRVKPKLFRFSEEFGGKMISDVPIADLTVEMARQFREHLLRNCSRQRAHRAWVHFWAVLEHGEILAGGQSLVPAMNFRLARPASLIDINRLDALDYVREDGGALRIGALARHAHFEVPVSGDALSAFLPRVARHIGHLPIRSRGTFCGSIAHADPASEWCLLAATLDAELVIISRRGQRTVRPNEYFVTALTTTLEPDEFLIEIRLPLLDDGWRTGFAEFSRRAGDYALAMCAAFLRFEDGRIIDARLGLGGATDRPSRIAAAEAVLTGTDGGPDILREAGNIAAETIDPLEDIQASAEYRRDLVRAMVGRALNQAFTQ